ncbi:MAG: response regulator [Anaerolineae bacterium]|nr:response regulator [Anaerolineae bacterium]
MDQETSTNILIVDDTPDNLRLLTQMLAKQYKIRAVTNGPRAIESAKANPPDLILLDVMMPQMTGYQVCENLKADAKTRDIPVIFISALGDARAKVKAFAAGGVDYVTKPLEIREISARVQTHLALRNLYKGLQEKNAQLEHEVNVRQAAEEQLRLYADQLKLLHEIDQSILAAQSPESIAVAAIGRIRRLMSCQRVTVIEITESGQLKELAAEASRPFKLRSDIDIYRPAFEGHLLKNGRVQGVADLGAFPQRTAMQDTLYEEGVRSYMIVPLRARDELIGSLHLEVDQANAFDAQHINAAMEIAALLAMAIQQTRLYAALHQRTLELEARNAELDAFAHTVAHDLKNPLTSLIGFSEMLGSRFFKIPQERLEYNLQLINQSAHKMNSIINELLLLSSVRGIESVQTQPLDMSDLIDQVRMRIAHLIDEYEPEIVLPSSWPEAWGYGPWIEEVWANYFSNALKYGGQPPRVEFGATPLAPGKVKFWVRDNGNGLAPEQQAQLFTPFERLHEARAQGHGLGLSIVQRIVEKLGGEVGVESRNIEGEGCTFYFTLPDSPGDKIGEA